jgi:glutaminase
VDEAHERYRLEAGGEVSPLYPALARMPPDLFGICLMGTDGAVYEEYQSFTSRRIPVVVLEPADFASRWSCTLGYIDM